MNEHELVLLLRQTCPSFCKYSYRKKIQIRKMCRNNDLPLQRENICKQRCTQSLWYEKLALLFVNIHTEKEKKRNNMHEI